ncbi:MAG: hypothetical protein VW437_01005 [Betaproteobacteria bacterium]
MNRVAKGIEDFSNFDVVYCDSKIALEWAYENGLKTDAIIKTSSPSLLVLGNERFQNIELFWTKERFEKFQKTIQQHTEVVYDELRNSGRLCHEKSVCIAHATVLFQRILYKAACLRSDDLVIPSLIIKVEADGGIAGNNINAPWDRLLSVNKRSLTVTYEPDNASWTPLGTDGVSKWLRFRVAGLQTLVYRIACKIMPKLPNCIFNKEVLIPSENELVIDTASALALRWVKVSRVDPSKHSLIPQHDLLRLKQENEFALELIESLIRSRVCQWSQPEFVAHLLNIYKQDLRVRLNSFDQLVQGWSISLSESDIEQKAVLTNSPGNIKGQSLALACRYLKIPFVSAQHGVTIELDKLHGEVSCIYDNSVGDFTLAFNSMVAGEEDKSCFKKANQVVVGASARHLRMKSIARTKKSLHPMVYISTNLYRGNIGYFLGTQTDYQRATAEIELVNNVLGKIPHQLRYKPYPDDNRRYYDSDPVLDSLKSWSNIQLHQNKVDMRYLLASHQVVITSAATSTLSWPIFADKPVVFINWSRKSPLLDNARSELAQAMFIFDDCDPDFYKDLLHFLSKPISHIEELWEKKRPKREEIISRYFSSYGTSAGSRSAKFMLDNVLRLRP